MKFLTLFVLFFSLNATGSEKSICGVDDRVPSMEPEVARALGSITGHLRALVGVKSSHYMKTTGN